MPVFRLPVFLMHTSMHAYSESTSGQWTMSSRWKYHIAIKQRPDLLAAGLRTNPGPIEGNALGPQTRGMQSGPMHPQTFLTSRVCWIYVWDILVGVRVENFILSRHGVNVCIPAFIFEHDSSPKTLTNTLDDLWNLSGISNRKKPNHSNACLCCGDLKH